MSVLQNLLAIVAKDTGGTAITALQSFQSAVDQTSDVQEVVAAGVQLEGQLVLALPTGRKLTHQGYRESAGSR